MKHRCDTLRGRRARIVARVESGQSARAIARKMKCHLSTVYRTVARYKVTRTFYDRPRSGRPSAITRKIRRRVRTIRT